MLTIKIRTQTGRVVITVKNGNETVVVVIPKLD